MNKLLTAVITGACALALDTASAERRDPIAVKAPGDYTVTQDGCTSQAGPSRDQCLKRAKIPPADPCAKLVDREQRECILDEFVQQHDR